MTRTPPNNDSGDGAGSGTAGHLIASDTAATAEVPARHRVRDVPASHIEVLSQLDRAPWWIGPSEISAPHCRAVLVRLLHNGMVEWQPPDAGGEGRYRLTPTGERALELHDDVGRCKK